MTARSIRLFAMFCFAAVGEASAEDRTENFDKDPGWEGINNRPTATEKRTVRQDFGFSKTDHAGGEPGEIGGFGASLLRQKNSGEIL